MAKRPQGDGLRPPPQRTCVACRTTAAKRGLVRVVRTPQDGVLVDITGKAAGRGAYLCRRPECWEAALKRDRLGAALRTKITPADRERLAAFVAAMRETATV